MHHLVIRVCFHPNGILLSHGFVRRLRSPSPQPWIALVLLSVRAVRPIQSCHTCWPSCRCLRSDAGVLSMQSRLCPGLSPGGWLGSQTRHSLRSHFTVFPVASRSLTMFSGHLGRHAFKPCQGRAGRCVSPVAGVISPSCSWPPLPVLCWPSGWGCLSHSVVFGFCLREK